MNDVTNILKFLFSQPINLYPIKVTQSLYLSGTTEAGSASIPMEVDWHPGVGGRHEVGVLPSAGVDRT